MRFNMPYVLEKQLEQVKLLDEAVFAEMSKPGFDRTAVGGMLEQQLYNWREIRAVLIGMIGEQHVLLKSFDEFLFERESQVTLLKLNIDFSAFRDDAGANENPG